ncbi:Hypothetical_protein [Hexamita inflata]|uniref:Hypothetical_protein n=1 Tax=Hexamita inflata TaxID=28002 RepID=A0AA86PXY3_9EUKA|nr:Hypothetical protein HINF_LOCUS36050 [Hexamita inflata]
MFLEILALLAISLLEQKLSVPARVIMLWEHVVTQDGCWQVSSIKKKLATHWQTLFTISALLLHMSTHWFCSTLRKYGAHPFLQTHTVWSQLAILLSAHCLHKPAPLGEICPGGHLQTQRPSAVSFSPHLQLPRISSKLSRHLQLGKTPLVPDPHLQLLEAREQSLARLTCQQNLHSLQSPTVCSPHAHDYI